MHRNGAQAVVVEPAGLSVLHYERIVRLAVEHKVPSAFDLAFNVLAGGLISYGLDLEDIAERAVGYVDRILRGARPAELPMEMPNKLEFVVNQRTALALGLTLPATLLARADQVLACTCLDPFED